MAGSPAAKRASASRRRAGQEYEPGRDTAGREPMRSMWADSARRRADPRHPAALQAPPTLATKSRPARLLMKSGERCIAQSHTETPNPSSTLVRPPSPGPMQTRQGGSFPMPRFL